MSRELVISTTRHETRLAILDDDQLVEIYIERESDQGLAGSIHKGRVTRVLPGMQSAFVDIGLERDAFLYVSDFLDTASDFEEGEDAIDATNRKSSKTPKVVGRPADVELVSEPAADAAGAESAPEREDERGGRERGGRRRRSRRGRRRGGRERGGPEARDGQAGLPNSKYASLPQSGRETARKSAEEPAARPRNKIEPQAASEFELLPGESLAKYASGAADRTAAEVEEIEADSYSRPAQAESGELRELPSDARAVEQPLDGPEDSSAAAVAEIDDEEPDQDDPLARWDDEDESDDEDDADESDDEEEEDDDEENDDDEDDADADDSDDDDDDDKGIDFSEHLAAAERIAALIEEQEGEDALEGGAETDSDGEGDEQSAEPRDDEQKQEIVEFRSDAGDDEKDDGYEASFVDETSDRHDSDRYDSDYEEKSVMPGQPRAEPARGRQPRREGGHDVAAAVPAGDADHASTVPGQPDSARVRGDRSDSRNLQRRGRRGRRRGGRSRDRQPPREERVQAPLPVAAPRQADIERSESPSSGKITDMLQKGNEILVQIAKEPLGKKGARITSHIALPGRYLVYMPTVDHIGVSRKIASLDERRRLRHVVRTYRTGMPGGFIVRTAGGGTPEEEIRGDMLFLYNLWLDIRQKSEDRRNPGLVHQDLDIVERILRDQLDADFKAIWVDSEDEYERILRFVERFQPSLLSKVKLYTRRRPVFDEFNITAAIEKAMRPKVWLKSGGYVVINQTEALVAVDVNTGKYVGKSDRLEDTIVNTNMEAAAEVVRQIRLRDLGGIIVVDFIDMDDRENRQKVLQVLEQAMQADPAPSKSLSFNDFGLVAITRKRVKQSLERTLCSPCPSCNGSGHVKSEITVILEILQEAHKMAPGMDPQRDITLRVNPEIGRVLKSRKNDYLQELETILKSHIVVRSDLSLHRERFDIN